MRKYLYISKLTIINQTVYRFRAFSALVLSSVGLLVSLVLWKAIFQGNSSIYAYTFPTMATYYALNLALYGFKVRNATGVVGEDIKSGQLSFFLLKPYKYNLANFVELFSAMSYRSIAPILSVIVLHYFFPDTFLGTGYLIQYVLMIAMGLIIGHLIYSSLGNIAFWTANTWGVFNIFKRVVDILGGTIIPLDFFPDAAKSINDLLPFKFLVYTPNALFLGRLTGSQIIHEFLLGFLWIAVLFLLNRVLWYRGMKKYESVGN